MEKNTQSVVTKTLSITGTALILLPILAPFIFGMLGFFKRWQYLREAGVNTEQIPLFNFDWLMPAELFPIALAGGIMLVVASLRAKSHARLIGFSVIAMIILPVAGQMSAIWTGLASGETEPEGWPWMIVVGFFIAYGLSLVVSGIGGILLTKHLFNNR